MGRQGPGTLARGGPETYLQSFPERVRPLRTITIAGRQFRLPRSRVGRVALGAALIVGGFVGFLPILGFWMLPLGLLILSVDLALVRRHRRRLQVWWGRRWAGNGQPPDGMNGPGR